MAGGADSRVLSRFTGRGGGEGTRSVGESLLLLFALGRLVRTGSSETPWSEAEVALADLIHRFGEGGGVPGALGAARPFTELSGEGLWVLDADVPAGRVRLLNERHVTGRLEPEFEQALRSDPVLARQAARDIAAGTFSGERVGEVLAAVGLVDVSASSQARSHPAGGRRQAAASIDDYLKLTVTHAREQFRALLNRAPAPEGKRQEAFSPLRPCSAWRRRSR